MPASNLNAGLNFNSGLPPKRAPGQPPLSTTLNVPAGQTPWSSPPASPAGMPSMASLDMPVGLSGTGLPNQSRFIPGAPALPNMAPMGSAGGMPGMFHNLQGSSLLGRDVSPAPSSPVTQPLHAAGAASLSFGGPLGQDPASAAQMAPIPSGRSIASLRAPRGTNFIRLAFAAIFLLGFLGLVGFLLKDHLIDLIPSLAGQDVAEESAKEESGIPTQLLSNPDPGASSKLSNNGTPEKPSPLSSTSSEARAKPAPMTVGFDPQEPTPSKVASAAAKEQVATALPSSSPSAASAAPVAAPPVPPAADTLLEVPAKPSMNAESSAATAASPSSLAQAHNIEEEDVPAAAQPAVEALKKFLNSKSLEERLKYTLGADMMKPHMERYYAHAPDGPILVDRIQFVRMDPNPELGSGKHCILSLENKTWEFSVPVMLEEKEDGFKVDWVAFVEFKDRMLEKFFQTYMTGKACFHVGIIRHHYFEDGVPNLDHKDAFRVGPAPPNSFQASVFLDKDSALAQELRIRMPWETHVWAVVELEWKKLGSQQWVELSAVPQMHWYSLPMAPKSNSPPQKTAEVDELPPGISKNGSRGKSGAPPTNNMPPPGIRKSAPDLPDTIKRPIPGGR
ncbi:MAG: hypothetical protein K9N47_23600 [Prosthecobacter sp.]|uniref:hypothetical protein n=1 Tax=Prosthecobacter sp. TaxID=1965333 RepID=UPI002614A626|nr:hypothetical protein [Prosthecobacter sp.]MCF7789130.1 hypothetical protein [Prosthecobacter sp.]